MLLAAYMVTGFLLASVYAVGLLRGRRDRYHRLGLLIPFTVAAIPTPIQFAVGDIAARGDRRGPAGQVRGDGVLADDSDRRTEYIGGAAPSDGVKGGIRIPDLDSFLAGFSTDTTVIGLDTRSARPPPAGDTLLHLAFDAMVGIVHGARRASGSGSASPGGADATSRRRAGSCAPRPSPAWRAIVALESGWIVTEVGRQPWVVYDVLRTADAVTQRQRRLGRRSRGGRPLRGARHRDAVHRCARCRGAGARPTGDERRRAVRARPAARRPRRGAGMSTGRRRRRRPLARRRRSTRSSAAPTSAPGSGS